MQQDLPRTGLRWLSILPFAFIFSLYLFAAAATIKLGHFPRCSADDPKSVGLDLFHHLVQPFFILLPTALPLWSLLWIHALIRAYQPLRKTLFMAVGWALLLVQLLVDPLRTFCWYVDQATGTSRTLRQ